MAGGINALVEHALSLNPIEQVFAKLKALIRKAVPRTREAHSGAPSAKDSRFSAHSKMANYLQHTVDTDTLRETALERDEAIKLQPYQSVRLSAHHKMRRNPTVGPQAPMRGSS